MISGGSLRVGGGRWWRMVLVSVIVAMMGAAAPAAKDGKVPNVDKGDLPQLSKELREAIRFVEQTELACPTKNSAVTWLRTIYDNLKSGRRSAAAGLLEALIEDLHSKRDSGLLTAAQRDALHTRLAAITGRVGTGWSTKPPHPSAWPPLPNCTGGPEPKLGSAGVVGGPSALTVHVLMSILVKGAFVAGKNIASLYGVEWPGTNAGIKGLINDAMADDFKALVSDTLDGLGDVLNNFVNWETCCAKSDPDLVLSYWSAAQTDFVQNLTVFQDSRYQVELLPLFAQYENLYITLLREAVLFGRQWGMSWNAVAEASSLLTQSIADATSYVNTVYKTGLDDLPNPSDPQKNFDDRNPYERDMRINVLDYADAWPYQDPTVHSFGGPDFRLTRMIYSDSVGHAIDTFLPPLNVDYPLSSVSVWTKQVYDDEDVDWEWWLTAMQTDNAPLTGEITGDFNLSPDEFGHPPSKKAWTVAPGSTLGPIVQVDTQSWIRSGLYKYIIQSVRFYFTDGTTAESGPFYKGKALAFKPRTASFVYDDEVLATAKIMGTFKWGTGNYTGDSLVLGFRYADSYYPSGEVRNVGANKCLDLPSWAPATQAVIHTCRATPSGAQDWTYNSTTQELTSSAGPDNGGAMCLAVSGTAAQFWPCNGSWAQKWEINSTGAIVNPQLKRCLAPVGGGTADGTGLELATCNGTAAQRWTTPWTTRQASTIQAGPGATTGACIEVQGGLRDDGTPVQMSPCNPNVWLQQWNYDTESLEVQVYGGTKCLAPNSRATAVPGTAVAVVDCTGDATQQWILGADTMTNDDSGLCLDRPSISTGAVLQVNVCNGSAAQQWNWPLR